MIRCRCVFVWPRMQLERHSWHLQTPKCRFEACSRRHWTGPAVIGLAPSCAIAHSVVSWTVPEIMHWWEDLVLGTSVLFGVIFSISKPRYDFGEPSWEMVLFFYRWNIWFDSNICQLTRQHVTFTTPSVARAQALSRKPLPERLVRLGHCMLVPALGASKQDDQLALGFKVEEGSDGLGGLLRHPEDVGRRSFAITMALEGDI